MNSKLPQINWRGHTFDFDYRTGIGGELFVGGRRLRLAALTGRAEICTPERICRAAEMVEAKLWAMNYEATLAELRA